MEELRRTGKTKHKGYDSVVFNKIKNILGGRLGCLIVASAPVSPQVLEFARIAFQCDVLEGYGQT